MCFYKYTYMQTLKTKGYREEILGREKALRGRGRGREIGSETGWFSVTAVASRVYQIKSDHLCSWREGPS